MTIENRIKEYPRSLYLGESEFTLRAMSDGDEQAVLSFAAELPPHDVMFMRRDITTAAGISKWIRDIDRGLVYTVLAETGDRVVGYSTIHLSDLEWSTHVAELRVTTAERVRGRGLGRLLMREAFDLALSLNIEKVIARMTTDQSSARALFHELGFHNEAILKDHVKDRDGARYDLLLMSCDVQTFLADGDAGQAS